MTNCKPISTPMAFGVSLSTNDGKHLSNPIEYQNIVGTLHYCTLTRLDISFSINKVYQFLHYAPTTVHWLVVKRILQYLKGTMHRLGLHFVPSPIIVTCFTDADWASCLDDRRSMSGYCTFLEHNLISWSSSKQKIVFRSSTESEYHGLANAAPK